jgi:Coenzyme PQQ synthesis protein D (PqqD)
MFLNKASSKIILRRGSVSNDSDGTPLLINYRGEAYRVNDTAVSLWNMCNGITFEDLFNEVLRISSGSQEDVRKSLDQMIQQLRKIAVVELKELK